MESRQDFMDIRKRQPASTNNNDSQMADHPLSRYGQTSVTEDTLSPEQTDGSSTNLTDQFEASKVAFKSETIVEVHEELDDDSPYEEVRAAVRNTDDNSPANTLRAWILGMFFVTVVGAINMLLSMRQPALTIPTVVVILLVYPLGLLWARFVPTKSFRTFGVEWTTNPGPWTIKEHTVVTLMASVTSNYPYSTNALEALQAKTLYNHNMGWGRLTQSYLSSVTN
jgi:hypothetical protein